MNLYFLYLLTYNKVNATVHCATFCSVISSNRMIFTHTNSNQVTAINTLLNQIMYYCFSTFL